MSLLLFRSLHALQGVAITGVLDLRELVALVVVVAAHESFNVRGNLDILLEVLKAFVRELWIRTMSWMRSTLVVLSVQ